ncbi:histidine kinase [Virgisporangium aliadipatigenens]|uniref:histidine kinase n=1 Tax=Virgisporangium aliadipatigenens TaxID=741659 RepID=A0A8J4DSF3_9ACTN|nr:PAS domain-containing sensor histidine kinase [Virgisporangium aliadipatigenens]GIJ47187.1 histidine kinase [Virgisporangium aliadipatigenens]
MARPPDDPILPERGEPDHVVGQNAADARLAAMVRSAHEAIIGKTLDGIITDWNAGAERVYGWGPEEVIGRHAGLLFPLERRDEEARILSSIAVGSPVERYRTQRYRSDGSLVTVSITAWPVRDGAGVVVGAASLSRVVSAEQLAEAKYFGLLEAAPDAIVAVDADGRIVLANAQTERLFGYARNELIGRHVETLVPDEQRGRHVGHRRGYIQHPVSRPMGTVGQQLEGQRRDGSRFPADISLSAVDTEGGRLITAAIRDASERLAVQAEHDRLKALAEEERLARRLQQTQRLESLGQLAGGVAHDFNNLLAVIVNYAAFVAEELEAAGEQDRERWAPVIGDVAQIQRAADRGIALTHQLLAFGRREVARPRVISVNDVIGDVHRMLGRSLGEHVELGRRLSGELWPVHADPAQLEQVLVNLAVNARDAMPGGGTVTMSTDNLEIHEKDGNLKPGRYVTVKVADSGRGMPEDVMARAFEPFFTTKPKGEGTGLGLATVYGIVTEAGGDVRIESELGVGTCFTLLLPATEEELPAPAPQLKKSRKGGGETILVCEDEPAIREVTRRILDRNGYEVILANDGMDAIKIARTREGPLHLLLTDVVMPQVLGKDVAEAVHKARPQTRVLYMSGYARPVLAGTGTLESGVTLVEKPFSEEVLLTAVREVLDA